MNIVHLCIIPAVYQRLYNPGVEHWRLQPLCNVFCHVYEKSLKWLEIDNISSASKHEPKSSNRFPSSNGCILTMFPSKFGHNWIILFTFMRPKNCAFNISFNKASWCKNMMACKFRWLSIFLHQEIFSIPMLFLVRHYLVCLLDCLDTQGRDWCFLYAIPCLHTVYHLPAKVTCVVWKKIFLK